MYISLSKDGWFGSTSVSSTDAYMTQTGSNLFLSNGKS